MEDFLERNIPYRTMCGLCGEKFSYNVNEHWKTCPAERLKKAGLEVDPLFDIWEFKRSDEKLFEIVMRALAG